MLTELMIAFSSAAAGGTATFVVNRRSEKRQMVVAARRLSWALGDMVSSVERDLVGDITNYDVTASGVAGAWSTYGDMLVAGMKAGHYVAVERAVSAARDLQACPEGFSRARRYLVREALQTAVDVLGWYTKGSVLALGKEPRADDAALLEAVRVKGLELGPGAKRPGAGDSR